MVKTMMSDSGLPPSFWVDALETAVYIKNRVYTRATNITPYEAMWGRRPDLHHIRRFGCLAYAHNKIGPSRAKFAPNYRAGFVLGYQEGRLGCKLYFPAAHSVGYALDAKYNEDVVYKDRHSPACAQSIVDLLCDDPEVRTQNVDGDQTQHNHIDETAERSDRLEEADTTATVNLRHPEGSNTAGEPRRLEDEEPEESWAAEHQYCIEGLEAADQLRCLEETEKSAQNKRGNDPINDSVFYTAPVADTIVFGGERTPDASAGRQTEGETDHKINDRVGAYLPSTRQQVQRSQFADDEKLIEPVKTRLHKTSSPGLREFNDDRNEGDFGIYAAFTAALSPVSTTDEHVWHESEIRMPRSFKDAMVSLQHKEWCQGMEKELAAMESKDVMELVPEGEVPAGKNALRTMWRYQLKSDNLGNVMRFRPRLVALGNEQELGIDYFETFSPVARMASLRLFVALCIILKLIPYQCDINTAYLNALLKILHYIKSIPGFPCPKGMVWKVKRALYGLHQSGREWNELISRWLIENEFTQCTTEPCLFIYREGDVVALLLLYGMISS